MITPAAITAWRSHDVSAIAASAWAMLIVDALLAGAYGLIADVDANLLYAAVATTGSLVILARDRHPRHTCTPASCSSPCRSRRSRVRT